MTKEEVEQAFNGLSPYYAYKQGLQDGAAYNEESFRREAAKDILCAMLGRVERVCTGVFTDGKKISDHKDFIKLAIEDANELIKQLKEE